MKTYKIITTCDAITEYTIKAETAEEAEAKYYDGEWQHEKITDYQNENIDTISEVN